MNEVSVLKSELIARLRTNRDQHHGLFLQAMEGYREQAIAELDELIQRVKAGQQVQLVVRLPIPQDHTSDYDAVIDMLEMSQGDTVEMTPGEFRQYARDEWGWKGDFVATASNYTPV